MAHPHTPKPSRTPKTRPAALQWSMDQEVSDLVSQLNKLTSSKPVGVGGWGEGNTTKVLPEDKGSGSHTHTHPHSPPPSLSPLTIDCEPALVAEITAWLKDNRITCVNYLLRNYTAAELSSAAADFVEALEQGFKPRNLTGFFRSLVKREER
jgi:hypothetical protein